MSEKVSRKGFIKVCGTAAAAVAANQMIFNQMLAASSGHFTQFQRAQLVKENGAPLTEQDLSTNKNYIFFYPYASTPCYLLNLGQPLGSTEVPMGFMGNMEWKGGIGSNKSIVSYLAICPHQWSHPTKDISFINYYPPDAPSSITNKGNVIQCCAHLSVFDPGKGGKSVEGPSSYPMTTIVLEQEGNHFYAVGTLGTDLFEDFFINFRSELRESFGRTSAAREQPDKVQVMEIDRYVKERVRC